MTDLRDKLYNQLKLLINSQFDELLFNCSSFIDISHLPETGASRADKARVLIRLIEQNESGLFRLQNELNKVNFFKVFLPEGAYPVGPELLELEDEVCVQEIYVVLFACICSVVTLAHEV